MAHITLMCDKGTIYPILPVTAECQTKPWERPAESAREAEAGGTSLRSRVSRFHSRGKGGYISLGKELNFLVTEVKPKNKNAPGEYIGVGSAERVWIH